MEKHMETEIAAINQQSFKDKIKSYTTHPGSFVLLLLVLVAAVLTVGVLVFLVGYILIRGIPYLNHRCLHGLIIRITCRCFRQ